MKEIRNCELELRANPENDRLIEGYAIVFNSESRDLGGFIETINPNALEGVLEKSDILCLLNHNEDKGVLARSTNLQGSLNLTTDNKGLKYSFEAPKTALGDETLEGIKRGDIRTSSFAFRIADGGDKWEKRTDGKYNRQILKFDQIFDVSPVYREAYPETSVAKRSLDEVIKQDEINLSDYYKQLTDKIEQIKNESTGISG